MLVELLPVDDSFYIVTVLSRCLFINRLSNRLQIALNKTIVWKEIVFLNSSS